MSELLSGFKSLILRGNLKRDFMKHLKGITLGEEESEPCPVGAFFYQKCIKVAL